MVNVDPVVLFQAFTICVTVYSIYIAVKWFRIAKQYEPLVKQLASILGTRSGAVRSEQRRKKTVAEGIEKATKNLVKNVPGLEKIIEITGLSAQEAFEIMTDPKVGPKLLRMYQFGEKFIGALEQRLEGVQKKTAKSVGMT